MKLLKICEFGNPILRQEAREVAVDEIKSEKIQDLIENMRHTLLEKKLGVALAAPQVGENLALVVIAVRPVKHRPDVEPFDLVMINPAVTETVGRRQSMWEGCISSGKDGKAGLFAKVPRYGKVKVKFLDENGKAHHKTFTNLKAQIIQHETDHINGKLFVDRVRDTKTYMTHKEYLKMIKSKKFINIQ